MPGKITTCPAPGKRHTVWLIGLGDVCRLVCHINACFVQPQSPLARLPPCGGFYASQAVPVVSVLSTSQYFNCVLAVPCLGCPGLLQGDFAGRAKLVLSQALYSCLWGLSEVSSSDCSSSSIPQNRILLTWLSGAEPVPHLPSGLGLSNKSGLNSHKLLEICNSVLNPDQVCPTEDRCPSVLVPSVSSAWKSSFPQTLFAQFPESQQTQFKGTAFPLSR